MLRYAALLLVSTLAACVSPSAGQTASIGRFVFAGPMGADGDVVSVKWSYGIQFTVNPTTISQVRVACAPIPGSMFVVQGADIKPGANGNVFLNGETLPVSKDTTPWLFEPDNTYAVCTAVVSRGGMPDVTIRTSVRFTAAVKAATVAQLKMAHEYNSKLNKK